jgi:hypothetical protein
MARPPSYHTADGARVPGVTSIISRFKDSGGLIHWAWEQGSNGLDYRQVRDAAANAGHVAHELIEAEIVGRPPVLAAEWDAAAVKLGQAAFGSFLAWRDTSRVEIVATERPLISEKFRYGGTLDAVGRVGGELCLLDWKSSNRIYSDYLMQLAAYRQLWEENEGGSLAGFHLLRVGKELGDFHHHYWPAASLSFAWEAFVKMRELYELDKRLKKAVG